MSLMDEVKEDVIKRNTAKADAPKQGDGNEKPKRRRRKFDDMTPEEREAYLEKKRKEEEDRYLKAQENNNKKTRKRNSKIHKDIDTQEKKKRARKGKVISCVEGSRPKILQPLETLYILKIPGLPKGDCIAICYARGIDQ